MAPWQAAARIMVAILDFRKPFLPFDLDACSSLEPHCADAFYLSLKQEKINPLAGIKTSISQSGLFHEGGLVL